MRHQVSDAWYPMRHPGGSDQWELQGPTMVVIWKIDPYLVGMILYVYIFLFILYIYIFMYWYRLIRDLYHRYWAIFDGDVTWHIPFIDWIRLVFLLQVPELSPDTYLTIVCWESWSYPEIGWYAQQCWCQGVAFWHIRLLEDSLTDAGCTCAHTFTWICWRWFFILHMVNPLCRESTGTCVCFLTAPLIKSKCILPPNHA